MGQEDTSAIFYDLAFIERRISGLKHIFPSGSLHAVAVKANPLTRVLEKLRAMGAGAEVASLPELFIAEKVGFAPVNIVFDSPCKTKEEIEYALRSGVYINADSFDELSRIAGIRENIKSESGIGLRINPQVGAGSITSTSVAGEISKFGIPLNDNKERIIGYFRNYEWLKGIHVHIGSQGCPVPLLVSGIRKVLDLALEVNTCLENASKPNRVEVFDIGGGLPVLYHPGQEALSMEGYAAMLKENCGELFTNRFRLFTEFGRYIHANAGWVASRVEYVKREKDYNIIMTHTGADLFLRKCYNPADWYHYISVVDKHGNLKTGTDKNKYTIAGPLCFAGDILARDIELPLVNEGDYLLIHDAGAYTLSMWSRYNSRQIPKVIGYYSGDDDFEVLKVRERPEDLVEFWS
jgi:diaminopimelate decarboxylase